MDDDGGKLWKGGAKAVPEPLGKNLAGGVEEAFDLVQAVVVEPLHDRFGGGLDVAVVDQVALLRGDVAFDDDVEAERVAVQPPALVVRGERRQVVGRLEVEGFAQSYAHRVWQRGGIVGAGRRMGRAGCGLLVVGRWSPIA